MRLQNALPVFMAIFLLTSPGWGQVGSETPPADTSKQDTLKKRPNYYENATVKIIYNWAPESPEIYRNVCCELIKEKGKVTEIIIYKEDCKQRIQVAEDFVRFEVRDARTGKLIARSR
ncbi:MAG: hypothetical protein GXO78_14130 [Calditrichaeota bacterium]|nr:hypothetical protein [Calditrichota bacterium]